MATKDADAKPKTRLERLEAQKKLIQEKITALASAKAKKERARRTRELIQLGAMLVADKSQSALVEKYQAQIRAEEAKKSAGKQVAKA